MEKRFRLVRVIYDNFWERSKSMTKDRIYGNWLRPTWTNSNRTTWKTTRTTTTVLETAELLSKRDWLLGREIWSPFELLFENECCRNKWCKLLASEKIRRRSFAASKISRRYDTYPTSYRYADTLARDLSGRKRLQRSTQIGRGSIIHLRYLSFIFIK